MTRICTGCERALPLDHPAKAKHLCAECKRDDKRLRAPLRPVTVDQALIEINNAAALWHGPASVGAPLRAAA
jgi:hypothetical protein